MKRYWPDQPGARSIAGTTARIRSSAAAPLRALLLARLAQVGSATADLAQREQRAREALAMARRLGDDEALAAALYSCDLTTWRPGQERTRLALLEEMIQVARGDRSAKLPTPFPA